MRSLVQPNQIWYGGIVRSEAAMRIMSDIGSKITHTFQITNDGPWKVDELDVVIEWPVRLAPTKDHPQGKWLLYLSEPPEVTPLGAGQCFVNPRMVNALGLRDVVFRNRAPPSSSRRGGFTNKTNIHSFSYSSSTKTTTKSSSSSRKDYVIVQRKRRRRRRSITDSQSSNSANINDFKVDSWSRTFSYTNGDRTTNSDSSEYYEAVADADVTLDCADDGVVQCHILTCRISGGLRANESAVVRLRSRVWNSTLVEEFGASASSVAILAKAHLMLPEELDIHQEIEADDVTIAAILAYPDASVIGDGALDTVPTWIILVSVFVGLIVVCCIAATLYKLGFFRRNRVPEDVMISAKVTSGSALYSTTNGGRPDDYIS